jgi:TonB family protein
MDRLQRKCAVASAGLHLLLAFILVFGPGFLAPSQKSSRATGSSELTEKQVIQLVPLPSEDPRVVQTPTASPSTQPKASNTARLPRVTTTPVNRNPGSPTSPLTSKRDPVLDNVRKLISGVHQGHPSASTQAISVGDGQDDEYAKFVREIYTSHWDLSGADANDAGALTKVAVTIASSGKVLSSRILRSSGNTQVDETVQRALNSVDFIRPFEDRAKEAQRTYTINFNCNAQQP